MYDRHHDIPALHRREGSIEAHYFNLVKRALKHIAPELRFRIPGMKSLDLILQRDAWVIVDRVYNDIPVVAWCGFDDKHRNAIHTGVGCEIVYFHAHAAMIQRRVLESMERWLADALTDESSEHRVLPFPVDGKK